MAHKTVKCEALVEFTRFVEGHGMIVGAPDSTLPEAKKPEVPVHMVAAFAAEGLVKAPKGFEAKAEVAADEAEEAGETVAP